MREIFSSSSVSCDRRVWSEGKKEEEEKTPIEPKKNNNCELRETFSIVGSSDRPINNQQAHIPTWKKKCFNSKKKIILFKQKKVDKISNKSKWCRLRSILILGSQPITTVTRVLSLRLDTTQSHIHVFAYKQLSKTKKIIRISIQHVSIYLLNLF